MKKDSSIFSLIKEVATKEDILYFFKKNKGDWKKFYHLVSLNPEILVVANRDVLFREVLRKASFKIADGIGTVIAGRLCGYGKVKRLTGVDLMTELLDVSSEMSLRVMLIGGRGDLAEKLADCYKRKYYPAEFIGIEGFSDINFSKSSEEEKIFSIISRFKPHLIFVAFGSPFQEKWIWKNRERLGSVFCMGVGGAFDFLGNKTRRAPLFFRKIGLEWLFRLSVQPWRWRRQLRLVSFVFLLLRQCLIKYNIIHD